MSARMLVSVPRSGSSLSSTRGQKERVSRDSASKNTLRSRAGAGGGGRASGKKKKMKAGSESPAGVADRLSSTGSSSGGDSPPTHSDDSGSDTTMTADSPKALASAQGEDASGAAGRATAASSSNSARLRTASITAKKPASSILSAVGSHNHLAKRTSRDGTPRASQSVRRAAAPGVKEVRVPSSVRNETSNVPNSGDSSSSSNSSSDAAKSNKRKADVIAASDGEQQSQHSKSSDGAASTRTEPPAISPLYGITQRRQPAGQGQPSIQFDRPPLNKHGVAQVELFISKWIEQDPDATELMQLHHMEAAQSQHHLKQIRKSLEEQMDHTKDLLKLVFDDRMDKIDPSTLAHLRDDSAMSLRRPEVPVCGEDGCKRSMHFCETARGDDNYENGCWECDKCDAEFDPNNGDAGCERWNCANCEYDMCQACAGVTRAQFEAWDARIKLLSSLEEMPKRWWVNTRSDPTRGADPAVARKRRRTGGNNGAGGRKKSGSGARQIGAGASIGSTGSWTVSAAAAALAFAPAPRASGAANHGVLPGAVNMGPSIVGKAIEVQWGRKAEWFAGFVTEYTDGQHHVKYNNGENEWVSLYRDFDNGVEWQMLPQRTLLPDGEQGTSAPGAKRHDLGDYEMLDGDDDEYADASSGMSYSSSSPAQQEREVRQARQYTGVHAMNGMFHASVRLWNRDVSLGFFDTALEAAVAHDQGMRTFYGPQKDVPLNFKDGKKGAVERRVAALIAENKHAIDNRAAAAAGPAEKGESQVNEKSDAASALNRVMNISAAAAVTMMGGLVSDVLIPDQCPTGRSRHNLCA